MRKSKYFISLTILTLMLQGCGSLGLNSGTKTTTTSSSSTAPIVVEPTETRVSFVGVGDNLIHEVIYLEAKKNAETKGEDSYDFTPMYTKVAPLIKKADLAFLNQETILGGDNFKPSGYPTFNTPTIMAQQMIDLGFDMFNQASNHSVDKGATGIKNAVSLWREKAAQYGIIMSGIYDSVEDRNTIRTITKNGITFALLAYTYGTNGIKVPESYMLGTFDKAQIKKDVFAAKEISDVVMVSVQWGTENINTINSQQKEFANYFNELGVDVVVGHHPHAIQPIDTLTNADGYETLVIYSLGNFIGGMLDVDNSLGGMVGMDFVKDLKTDKVHIENISWTPLVIHFDGNPNNVLEERFNFEIIPLGEYTDEMASKHALNGYDKQSVSVEYFKTKTQAVIGNKAKIILD